MRPIHLSLSGLQSYREKQEIDFVRLCEAGVFGIFGPTGSGKSTVLDAVTLALYGKVGRADKGTHGIINQAENALTVSFTFELTGAQGKERYRVERQFKRSGDLSAQNTLSRLIRLTAAGSEVLADKMGEVTARIEEIIGLSMSDFTRAVVLPQGKFAEFLSLAGKDRRQMLQRLFHLEPYGDRMLGKLSAQSKAAETELKEVAAEQLGLGDASAEALQRAGNEFKQAEATVQQTRGGLAEWERRYETGKQVWQWQSEKNELEEEFARLSLRETDIQTMELKLARAEAAETLLPLLREMEAALAALAEKNKLLREAEERNAEAVSGLEKVRETHLAAQTMLSENEPQLAVRLAELEHALALEREIERLAKEEGERNTAAEASAMRLKAQRERSDKEQELYERAQDKQSELKRQLALCEMKFADRQKLQAAIRDKQQLDWSAGQVQQCAADIAEKERLLAASERRINELKERDVQLHPKLIDVFSRNRLLRERLRQTESGISRLLDELGKSVETIKREERLQETSRMASILADRLASGEPCPVCGSPDHPHPAAAAEGPTLEANANLGRKTLQSPVHDALQLAETLLQQTRELHFRCRHLTEKADSCEQSAGEYGAAEDGIRLVPENEDEIRFAVELATAKACTDEVRQEAQATPELPGMDGKPEPPKTGPAAVQLAFFAKLCRDFAVVLDACQTALAEAEAQFRQYLQSQEKGKAEKNEAAARHQAVVAMLEEARRKQSGLLSEQSLAAASWKAAYPEMHPGETDAAWKRLEEMDRQADELRARLQTSETFLQDKREKRQQLERDIADTEKAQLQEEGHILALREVLKEKQRELRNKTGGLGAEAQLKETRFRLDHLRAEEKLAKGQLDEAVMRQQQSAQQFLAAAQGKEFACDSSEKAERAWLDALRQTSFADDAEVRQALLDEWQKQECDEEVRLYRERERELKSRIHRLAAQLAGQSLSVRQWEAMLAGVGAAREDYEAALQNFARAGRDLEDLRERHLRFCQLENRRQELSARCDRLLKLQSVFRGNAFVEFLAEEQLMQVCRSASERLGFLTRRRYALEVDSGGGFVIRDDANGGVRRPVSTLSGGETFLASLALALALSAQIQLKGIYPLEFFFLDEGFGMLDAELLETVVSALERLHADRLSVGVISHVPELRARLPRRLIVHPAEPAGRGSRVEMETL